MNEAEAAARLDSELKELLAQGQLLTQHRDLSTRDLHAFRSQLVRTMTAAAELRRKFPDDAEKWFQVFRTFLEDADRGLEKARMYLAHEVVRSMMVRLMIDAQLLRDRLAVSLIRNSASRVVPISTGKSTRSPRDLTAATNAAKSTRLQGAPPAERAGPVYEPRFLAAKGPSIAGLRTKFTVKARIDIRPRRAPSVAMAPMNIPDGGLVVSIHAALPGDGLELVGPESRQVHVFAGIPSDEVEFQFKTLKNGPAKIALRAYVDQSFRGELVLELEVADKGIAEQQENTAEIGARKPPPRQATLEIEYQRVNNAYRYVLRGPGAMGTHRYEKQLTTSPGEFVTHLMSKINGAAKNRGGQHSDTAIETMLKGIGTNLWEQLLPVELQAKLVSHWTDIDRLELLCGEEPLPWELLYCQDQDAFIADHWLVFRWMYGAPAPFEVGIGPACYVMASPPLPNAEKEIQAARAIYPSSEIWTTVDQLIAGLKKADMGLLHFAAHNVIHYPNAGASAVKLDATYDQDMLAAQKKASLRHYPLVFLNACSSAAAAEQLVGCASWAGRFLGAGAGAFIGSMWEIRDVSACDFSDAFYRQTQQGSPLGEAFRQARAALGGGDPTRFAYTFFGDPDAALSVKEH